MVHHLERTDSKDRMAMLNDHDSVSSGETAAAAATTTCPGAETIVPKVEVDHSSDGSSSQKDSDSPPSSPSVYNLLHETSDQIIKFTPPECMHLLIDRLNSSSSTTQFLKKVDTDPSLSLSDEGDYPQAIIGLKCSPSVAVMLKSNDICFVHWNWPRIRMLCTIFFWAGMIALLALAIGLVVTAPRSCQPSRSWWQGAAFYEVFPAAFQDTDQDGVGDLRGITRHLDYIGSLGITVLRLNAIFESDMYPTRYWATLNHTSIASRIGTIQDFEELIRIAHERKLKVVLDFNPLFISKENPLTDPANYESNGRTGHRYFFLKTQPWNPTEASSDNMLTFKDTMMLNLSHDFIQKKVEEALDFWLSKHVDGFYMKYIEHVNITLPSIQTAISHWRTLVDRYSINDHKRRSLICSGAFADMLESEIPGEHGRRILENFDLVDYDIQMTPEQMDNVPHRLEHGVNNTFGEASPLRITPWLMWSVGSAEKSRLATRMGPNRSLATILLHLMLPGSVNLLYGDEIYLEDDENQSPTVPMRWLTDGVETIHHGTLPHSTLNTTLKLLREVLHLRNTSTPLLHAFLSKTGEEFVTPNYRLRLWKNGVLVLERFYPRWNSVIMLVNLNETAQDLDISSLFYQGKVMVSTYEREQYITFNNIRMKSGEVLITEI